jgi:hypothetical protein
MFRNESMIRIDRYTRAARTFYNLNRLVVEPTLLFHALKKNIYRWIAVRVKALSAVFTASLAAYLVYGPSKRTASDTGFSLSMAVVFSGMILLWVRIVNDLEGKYIALVIISIELTQTASVEGNRLGSFDELCCNADTYIHNQLGAHPGVHQCRTRAEVNQGRRASCVVANHRGASCRKALRTLLDR